MRRCRINLPNRCYHLRAYTECGMMLAESGYVDANPVNAGIVDWPDGYEWCSYAAACRGDETARPGYDFVYGGKGRPWPELKELHDISIRQMLKSAR